MQKLIHGIHQFRTQEFRPLQQLFEQLAQGQKPETLFITCSDSRIDPNLLTGSKPGDLFILRNAGNLIPPPEAGPGGEAATIEFAVVALGVRDIIVCGHSHCGAIGAVIDPSRTADLPAMAAWLRHADVTRELICANYPHLEGDSLVMAAVQENVLVQLERLAAMAPVAERLEKGDLHVHGWVYKIETGEVFAYDVTNGQYVPVAEYRHSPSDALARRDTLPRL